MVTIPECVTPLRIQMLKPLSQFIAVRDPKRQWSRPTRRSSKAPVSAVMRICEDGMREPHWYPVTAPMGYGQSGSAR
jgi:hypothetical protein